MTHYPLCPITSFDPVCDGKDCTCQCDFIASIREGATGMALRYLQTHTATDATGESHHAGYADGYADGYARARADAIGMALRYLQTHTRNDTLTYLEEGGM